VATVTALALSRGYLALVDPEDFERFCHLKWYPQVNGRTVYATTGNGIMLHRLILDAPKGVCVDHINRDGLDNRRSNLRLATQAQNTRNSAGRVSKHGFTGVCWYEFGYYGRVRLGQKQHTTITVPTAEEAARLRDELAQKLHGDFAVLNFPTERIA